LEVLPPLQSPSLQKTRVEHPSLNPPLRNATPLPLEKYHLVVLLLPPRAKHPRDLVAMPPPDPLPVRLEVPLALLEVPLALLEVHLVLPVVLVE